ncbi:hypothetical protein [Sodalinema gerasimenkoae]|uniref:hypothetical protein n=1 Tax=Sodalinema gerasimenkoae TaxID=2862348 RepID=UPI00135BD5BE|nr:hypothetical protein [Sodalinema gerasimenkoae]
MMTTDLTLDKKAHPLMMHLSIVPKIEITEKDFKYDPKSQTSNVTGMSGSWCTRASSTFNAWGPNDDDQQEDD